MVRFGLTINGDSSNLIRVAQQAEGYGMDSVWMPDSPMIFRDPYIAMTQVALNTTRIRLATGVTNPVIRHPAATACAIATLDEVSKGRIVLGIGGGDSAVYTLGLKPAPLVELKETVHFFKKFFAEGKARYHGVEIKNSWGSPKPIPVHVAASGPKALRLGGEVADGVTFMVGVQPELVKYALRNIAEGCKKAGRKTKEVETWFWTPCLIEEDRRKAYESMKSLTAHVLFFLAKAKGAISKNEFKEAGIIRKGYTKKIYEFYQKDTFAGEVTADMVDAFTLTGGVDHVKDKLRQVISSGVDNVCFLVGRALSPQQRQNTIKALGEDVLPSLK